MFRALAFKVAAIASVALIAVGGAQAATNLVMNGSFETGDFTGWTQIDNTGFTGVGVNFGGVNPTDGSYQAYFGPVGSTGGISQTIVTSGGTDNISFDLYNFGGTPNSVTVTFGGSTLLNLTDADAFGYTHYSFAAPATGSSTVLTFEFRQDPSYYLLDNVSVSSAPEPATWALMLAGFGGLGAAMRSRRRVLA